MLKVSNQYFTLSLAILSAITLIFSPFISYGEEDKVYNPRRTIGDPNLARLQQGRTELTALEKEEIKKYNHTALEIMTYVHDNKHSGADNDEFHRCYNMGPLGIRAADIYIRSKYNYKNYRDLLTYNGIKPGDLIYKRMSIITDPVSMRGDGTLSLYYLKSFENDKDMTQWSHTKILRKLSRVNPPDRETTGGMITTRDDDEGRYPWEENHKIIGEDQVKGKDCFVIESIHKKPTYYLSKRVIWIEKENYLDLHEEQFDRKGILFKIFDKDWYVENGYWVPEITNVVDLSFKRRTIHHNTRAWLVNQGLRDIDFSVTMLFKGKPWRDPKDKYKELRPLRDFSVIPPEPTVKEDFWKRMGIKVVVHK